MSDTAVKVLKSAVNRSRKFPLRVVLRGIATALVILSFCDEWRARELGANLPIGGAQMSSGLAAPADRLVSREPGATAKAVLVPGRYRFTTGFARAFVDFDRKQNTRLWPFILKGQSRSPPLVGFFLPD